MTRKHIPSLVLGIIYLCFVVFGYNSTHTSSFTAQLAPPAAAATEQNIFRDNIDQIMALALDCFALENEEVNDRWRNRVIEGELGDVVRETSTSNTPLARCLAGPLFRLARHGFPVAWHGGESPMRIVCNDATMAQSLLQDAATGDMDEQLCSALPTEEIDFCVSVLSQLCP